MSRVLVVGWDGATWSVAGPLADAGRLPALSALRAGGAEGVLESVPNMNSAPAWSTVATGLLPGRHGIFYFDERVPGTYGRRLINARRRSGATLWRMASEGGKRIVVVNVPISYPAEPVNGFLVAGLDTPSKDLPGFAHPEDLPRRYELLFRDYVVEPEAAALMRSGRREEAERSLLRSIPGWAAITERLMRDEAWDLAFVVFTSSDTAQHFFWTADGMPVIERVYEAQDEATGRLVALAREADPDVNVLVLADHGGEANTRGPEFLPVWLEDQGLMARSDPPLRSRALAAGFELVNRTLSREQKRALAKRLPRLQQRAQAESRLAGIEWRRTRAFSDGVRDDVLVNLQGREPAGTVPAQEHDRFVAELAGALEGIREEGTGDPVVSAALRRGDVYRGPFVERAPDITLRWRLGRPFRGFRCETSSARARMQEVAVRPPAQPGGHHPHGLFVGNGPNIGSGDVAGTLADVAPTVLALLGVPVPDGLDGRVLPMIEGVAVEGAAATAAASSDDASGYSAREEEEIRQRLEDLGYI